MIKTRIYQSPEMRFTAEHNISKCFDAGVGNLYPSHIRPWYKKITNS
jgi:hypothetical protein